jgi:hypothetical protein
MVFLRFQNTIGVTPIIPTPSGYGTLGSGGYGSITLPQSGDGNQLIYNGQGATIRRPPTQFLDKAALLQP